ncbi:MAG: hypothetical protein WCZ89_09465, partial [Phycisphaerae bacterium]
MQEVLTNNSAILRLYAFDEFAETVNRLGCNFALCDDQGGLLMMRQGSAFSSDKDSVCQAAGSLLKESNQDNDLPSVLLIDKRYLGIVLTCSGSLTSYKTKTAAVIDIGEKNSSGEGESSIILNEALTQMLVMLSKGFKLIGQTKNQIETISTELSQVYEELVLLHKLSSNMNLTESDCNYLQMACDSLTEIVPVEGIAILLEKGTEHQKQLMLAAGAGIIDINPHMAAILHSRLEEHINSGKEALLDSAIDKPFRYQWDSTVKNIIIVPLLGKESAQAAGLTENSRTHHI